MHSRSAFLTTSIAAATAAGFPNIVRAENSKLRVGCVPTDVYAEPYYGQAAGTFAKHGFDLEIVPMPNGPASAAALAGGALELGIIDFISSAAAIIKGVPLQLVAGSGLYEASAPVSITAVAASGPIRGARDLEGKTMALPVVGGIALVGTRAWLKQNGADPAKVNFIEFNSAAMATALARGTFDAAFLNEPFVAFDKNDKNDVRDIGHPLDAVAKEFLVNSWFAQKSWIDADPARARRVVDAVYETARYANSHRAETLAVLAKASSLDIDKLRRLVRSTFATTLTPAMIQPVLDIGTESKLLPQPMDAKTLIVRI
jgi:NitT/TauT family transport system substrate-binding protein